MIGIDRQTGKTISGTEQLASRIREVFTTKIGTLPKRRGIGTDLLNRLGNNLTDIEVAQTQHHLLERLKDPVNGLIDVTIQQASIRTIDATAIITVRGQFKADNSPFEVNL